MIARASIGPCLAKAAERPAGAGALARVLAIWPLHAGLGSARPSATGSDRVSSASSGTQISSQTRNEAWAFKVTVSPGLAVAGAVIGTGSSTSSL